MDLDVGKLQSFTSDNATSIDMTKYFKEDEYDIIQHGCYAHVLNLISSIPITKNSSLLEN